MKHYKILQNIAIAGTLFIASTACNQDNYLSYDEGYHGIYFTEEEMHYSFGTLPIERRAYTLEVPVKIMGPVSDTDRLFKVEILPAQEFTDPVEGKQYEMPPETLLIEAGAIEGIIPLILLRDGLEGSDDTGYTKYELRLRLVANDNFVPTLGEKEQNIIVTFDNAVDKPDWYREDVWNSKCGLWAPIKLIKIMEFFNTTLKEQAPTTYEKMVADIGENWENVTYGWPTDYNYSVKKYILIPCYEFFLSHPEYGVTDFPDPNAKQ